MEEKKKKKLTYSKIARREMFATENGITNLCFSPKHKDKSPEEILGQIRDLLENRFKERRARHREIRERVDKFLQSQGIENPKEEADKNDDFGDRRDRLQNWVFQNCEPGDEPLDLKDWWLRN